MKTKEELKKEIHMNKVLIKENNRLRDLLEKKEQHFKDKIKKIDKGVKKFSKHDERLGVPVITMYENEFNIIVDEILNKLVDKNGK